MPIVQALATLATAAAVLACLHGLIIHDRVTARSWCALMIAALLALCLPGT